MDETLDLPISIDPETLKILQKQATEAVGAIAEEPHGHHDEPFYMGAEFWVAVSVVLVIVLLFKPVGKIMGAMMRKRIDGIVSRIDEVDQLKLDAEKLLAEYEKKFAGATKEADEILEKSKREMAIIKKDSMEKLERELKNKEKDAASRIERASRKAVSEIATLSSELAIETVKMAVKKKLDSKAQDKLIEASIARTRATGGTTEAVSHK
jgi:F-type H+-transporting ATPase subunit b